MIVGLGMTEMGRIYDRSAQRLAADAVTAALADAGLAREEVDGLLISNGVSQSIGVSLQVELGLRNLRMVTELNAFGATAGVMVQDAALAIEAGVASTVVCVFADTPLRPGMASSSAYRPKGQPVGWLGLKQASGYTSPTILYAVAARRHMMRFGTTSEQLAQIAVAQREWASLNPLAQKRGPITVADHQSSRMVADPLRLLDCCLVSNGAIAVVLTRGDHAYSLRQPPVAILGWAQAHPGTRWRRDDNFGLVSGAAQSGPAALRMAGINLGDIDQLQLYDCYSFTMLLTLEDYGFCAKGEGGAFVASPGVLGPGGSLPVNTGGGQLSGYYMWGMTPLSEAIIQIRGQAGARQVDRHDVALVSGNGGVLDHHSSVVLASRY